MNSDNGWVASGKVLGRWNDGCLSYIFLCIRWVILQLVSSFFCLFFWLFKRESLLFLIFYFDIYSHPSRLSSSGNLAFLNLHLFPGIWLFGMSVVFLFSPPGFVSLSLIFFVVISDFKYLLYGNQLPLSPLSDWSRLWILVFIAFLLCTKLPIG